MVNGFQASVFLCKAGNFASCGISLALAHMALSPNLELWNRLTKKTSAIVGLVIITASIFVSLFAYYIAPDSTPFANRQVVEIGRRKPGAVQQFLLLPRGRPSFDAGVISRLVGGKEDAYRYLPINSYSITNDSVVVQKFVDEGISERQSFGLKSIQNGRTQNELFTTKRFLLGTDNFGRDILSRLLEAPG